MAKKVTKKEHLIAWVKFPKNNAILRHIIFPSGKTGLHIQFSDNKQGEELREAAIKFGFNVVEGERYLTYKPTSPSSFNPEALAKKLGGKVIAIPKATLMKHPWTIDISRMKLGRNFIDEVVFRYESGERSKQKINKEGKVENVIETKDSDPTEFLRATKIEHLPRIATGLLKMAKHGTVDEDDLKSIADAACEPRSGTDRSLDSDEVEKILNQELLGQLVSSVVEDGGSRESYHQAMILAERSESAVRVLDELKGLIPTPRFLVFLRRLTLGVQEIEFSGNSRLEMAAPALRSEGKVSHQLLDLTVGVKGGASERAANALAGRTDKGHSILLVEGSAESHNASAVRQSIGHAYAFEVVAEISPMVATGLHVGEPITAFIVGEKRPRLEESLPKAAQRTFKVEVWSDLDQLHTELLRNRRRIADWHLEISDNFVEIETEENTRQRPYVSLSQVSTSTTMIPKSLEGATAKALRRIAIEFEKYGGIDEVTCKAMDITFEELRRMFSAEQVDAFAMQKLAAMNKRGFLLADQTGVGKGRVLAAIAGQHLRNGGKVLYFTENSQINIPDVWRDFLAVGANKYANTCIIATRPVQLVSPGSGDYDDVIYKTESAESRKRIIESKAWPLGKNLVITNYTQFSRSNEHPSNKWAKSALDKDTLLILDESHNAINKKTNTGIALRTMINQVGNKNVIFATATPMRDPKGADLYRPLLPPSKENSQIDLIIDSVANGGETAQECFTTMLAEDGVFLRRDHNLSNIEFLVRLPNDERIAYYQNIITLFSPLSELMLGASLKVGALVGRGHDLYYQDLIAQGMDDKSARANTNSLFQYSAMAGSPLANLARLTINTIKVNQVVEETMNEIREGRKPQVTFHSTYNRLFSETVMNSTGEMEIPLSFCDQVERVSEQIFNVVIGGTKTDARELDPEIAQIHEEIQRSIDRLPKDLPASPLDAVIEGLEANGLVVGEISGRSLAYRNGRIVRLASTNRRKIVKDYNDGKIDVLLFNRAGATGGSYHAAPEFRDQRPRSLIEMETPLDIIKYIQAQGRSNRLGQVARPRIVSVMTGLIPEMRILQQRNRKLRSMGASIDGNRSHPLLLDDVPDLLNRVGDSAVKQVLKSSPQLARKLGFATLIEEDIDDEHSWDRIHLNDSGSSSSGNTSLANRVLTRSLVLTAIEQTQLIELITIEFEAIIEELESRNANPLKPKEYPGEIEVKSTMLFSGLGEVKPDHIKPSAFSAPLYISIGTQHIKEEPIGGDELLQMVNTSKVIDGGDGFSSFADYVESRIPTELSHLVPPGRTVQETIEDTSIHPIRFWRRHSKLNDLVKLLRKIKIGCVLQIDGDDGSRDSQLRTIVKLIKPPMKYAMLPQSYKLRTLTPGHSKQETMSINQLMKFSEERVRILSGLERGRNDRHLRKFNKQTIAQRRYPVQILTGNLLEATSVARMYRLGSMSVYRDTTGQLHRGVVVTRKNVALDKFEFTIPTVEIIKKLIQKNEKEGLYLNIKFELRSELEGRKKWLSDIIICEGNEEGTFKFLVWSSHDLGEYIEERFGGRRNDFNIIGQLYDLPHEKDRLINFLNNLEPYVEGEKISIMTEGKHRRLLSEIYLEMKQEMKPQDGDQN